MLTVASILKSKADPRNEIAGNAKAMDALVMMNSMNLDYLVVIEDGHFRGIFSERDYGRQVIHKNLHRFDCQVQKLMSSNLPFVDPDSTAEQCITLMNLHQTHYLPVFENGKFLGIITVNDVLQHAARIKNQLFDEERENIALPA